jgi:hypothetical protein
VYKLVERYTSSSPEDRKALVSRISRELYIHAKSCLGEQGVPLLNDV